MGLNMGCTLAGPGELGNHIPAMVVRLRAADRAGSWVWPLEVRAATGHIWDN